MYEVVLLDIDDTLFDYQKAEEKAMYETFYELGFFEKNSKKDYEKFVKEYEIINLKLWNELEKGKINIENLKINRFKETFNKINLNYYDEKEFSKKYLEKLGEGTYLFDGAEKFVKYLSEKNYKLAIITNGIKEVQIPRIKNLKINKYIETIIISEEVGASKPNPLIFEKALEKLEYRGEKNKVIMIGDSQTADIKGANNFEIDSCWINLVKRKKNETINATFEVESYEELYEIL